MDSHASAGSASRLASLIAQLYRIATGSNVSAAQAMRYFHDPSALVWTIRASGALKDPQRAKQIRELLSEAARRSRHGI